MSKKLLITLLVLFLSESKAQHKIDVWNQIEFVFESDVCYDNPFLDVDLFATFISEEGDIISRPAFWDGGNIWKVRFAPTKIGKWNYKLSGEGINNFNGSKKGYVEAFNYQGDLSIYKKGFLKISPNRRYLTYNNGAPFFYLADTHWFLPLEKWDECNVPGCDSQFKFMVDKRAEQQFTVYQIQTNGIRLVEDSVTSVDVEAFQDIDRKFNYLIEKGFIINSSIGSAHNYALRLGIAGAERLAKYWVARYGAYPIIWMTAQEVDLDKNKYLEIWKTAAKTIDKYDDYQHPHSAHLWDNSNPAFFNSDNWHNFHMIQAGHIIWGGGTQTKEFYKKYYESIPIKPMLESEANYEGLGKDKQCSDTDIRNAAYKSFLSGSFGFGYGVQGIWQNCYTVNECGCCTDWGIKTWIEGLNAKGGEQMSHLKKFFDALKWTKLEPRFEDPVWIDINASDKKEKEKVVLSTISNNEYVIYLYSEKDIPVTIKNLDARKTYKAKWFDPRKGVYINIDQSSAAGASSYNIPVKPSAEDYIYILTSIN
ncbi:MAG: DUF4038 domain-containing protein [Melioribacteraceae bacterium]|nr:DUF4038 domain-containing protein [Melioribacteraceae bacterium]